MTTVEGHWPTEPYVLHIDTNTGAGYELYRVDD